MPPDHPDRPDHGQNAPAATRPPHKTSRFYGARAIALVGVGGMIGTAARHLVAAAVPAAGGLPLGILGINLIGAFLLGWLLEALTRSGPDTGRRFGWRLFAGTGLLGGFTTYSALSVDTVLLIEAGRYGEAALYALGTLLLGLICSALGVAVSAATARGRHREARA